VQLLPTAEGGRTAPISGSYRPHHNFFGPNDLEMAVGFIEFPEGRAIWHGESIELPITFVELARP